uniref:AlNc14C128G6854 protein n=1 Tax=Albugo laibachii Nc14 TaxID=890382 RepID=F0WJY8_9STRA|nr:AlNc14C128G6854 [Albugo laibachii Nc14]|eukprot:CCA21590.1 AlNc14C128G6854 [Albugo laibachii Nc14]
MMYRNSCFYWLSSFSSLEMAAAVAMAPREPTRLTSSLQAIHDQKGDFKSSYGCASKAAEVTGSAECLLKLAPKKRWILLWRQQEQGRKVHAISKEVTLRKCKAGEINKVCVSPGHKIIPRVESTSVPISEKKLEEDQSNENEKPVIGVCVTPEANQQAESKAHDNGNIADSANQVESTKPVKFGKPEVTENLLLVSLTASERMRLERKKSRKSNWDVGTPEYGNANSGSTLFPAYFNQNPHAGSTLFPAYFNQNPHAGSNYERYSRSQSRTFTPTYRRRTDLAFRPRSFHEKNCRNEYRDFRSRSRSKSRFDNDNFPTQVRSSLHHQSF